MAKNVSIYNELIKMCDSLMLFSGNIPRDNVMLRHQSCKVADLTIDAILVCGMALKEPDLTARAALIERLRLDVLTVDVVMTLWWHMKERKYSKNHPIVITSAQYAIYAETYTNIINSIEKWLKRTRSEEPKPVAR